MHRCTVLSGLTCVIWGLVLLGCAEAVPPAVTPPATLRVPVEMRVPQRTTTVLPQSEGKLQLTVDDVTRNQVMTSLALVDEQTLLVAPMSLSPGTTVRFTHEGRQYNLELVELRDALIGEDFATFRITAASGQVTSEQEKIEHLIKAVADLREAVFIRNDVHHTAEDAADHLRTKWRAAGNRVQTAEDFITHVASQSSRSGRAYHIQFVDGRTITAGEFLRQRLREIEAAESQP